LPHLRTAALAAALSAAALTAANAQSNPKYLTLPGVPSATKAVLYTPDGGVPPHVAVLLIHRTSNFLAHIATGELSKRGFMVLAMNPRSDNNESKVIFEDNALDIKAGVNYLRTQPGITKVLLFGHSGGGPATSFYAAVAENGVAYCQGANKLSQCGNNLAGLPRIDGIVTADAHPGIGINELRSVNPAVQDETDPRRGYQRRLDPFNPANGYNPNGPSSYSDAFKANYFAAQSERMNKLIAMAQARLAAVANGDSALTDDEPFIVYKGDNARLLQLDRSIHHQTAQPEKLLKNDGSIVTQIVESVRVAQPELKQLNATLGSGTLFLTAKSFLSANAVKSTDAMDGIDYCSSNNSTLCALQNVSVPLLITTMGGHYFIRDNELIFQNARSPDKDFIVIEGAVHGLTECTACETTPGQYSNVTKNLFNYIAAWINTRF
jgi:pimeloyl-ACP methyl ester carboxylesterase